MEIRRPIEPPKQRLVQQPKIEESLSTDQSRLITEDPATFFIVNLVVMRHPDTISGLKKFLSNSPEIQQLVEPVLKQMEEKGLIEVQGDRIQAIKADLHLKYDLTDLQKFLSHLMKIATERVLKNHESLSHASTRMDTTYFFMLPSDPETAKEVRAIYQETKMKLYRLVEKSKHRSAESVRFVGITNSILEAEDFV